MAGYPSNLAKKFFPTEEFPQHILPLLPLYNAQWWGYESLTVIVLVSCSSGKRSSSLAITSVNFTNNFTFVKLSVYCRSEICGP